MVSLYVHIPFCDRKCIYCNFYSIESFDQKDRFLDSLLREIRGETNELPEVGELRGDTAATIFLGGGTPSLLNPDEIASILDALESRFPFGKDIEITMECNPGTLRRDWLEGYRAAGVNRLSFGVQSFHNDDLEFLSRIHSAEQAEENIRVVRSVFDNVSLDLIFALPGQTRERWRHNLERAVALGTDHVSAYALIYEEGTPLYAMHRKGLVDQIPDDLEADLYDDTLDFLESAGLKQYETSNFAIPGFESWHNARYWERKSYVGFGPSAHSFSDRSAFGTRWANVSSLNAWMRAIDRDTSPRILYEEITRSQAVEETVMLGLRYRGLSLDELERLTDVPIEEVAPKTLGMITSGEYGSVDNGRLALGRKGSIFADRIALELCREIESHPAISSFLEPDQ